jgi:aldose 1-epimerase
MDVGKRVFGTLGDGRPVHIYTLINSNGVEARITNYGGALVSLRVPDRHGRMGDVVLGYDTLEEYIGDENYFGCIVGRYANRIAGGRFSLNGVEYRLARNDGVNHLHGGVKGFNKVLWEARETEREDGVGLSLAYLSRHGEEGYPGDLSVRVLYLLTDEDELRIEYAAATDRDTVVNLTHHSYFNLAGARDVLGHALTIYADHFTPVDETLIPTGELRPIEGTPMDFTEVKAIGADIDADYEQLHFGKGYDHNWVLNEGGEPLAPAARVYEPATGRAMEVHTTEPGFQLYTGNHLDGVAGKGGRTYGPRSGLCLEAQHFPDSPNRPEFPSTILRAGETYTQTTIYRFLVR